jgi:hypothetical protein
MCPCPTPTATSRSAQARSRGSELSGGEGLTEHDLRNLGSGLGGSVVEGWRWDTAGDGKVRRPRQVTGVPGEGPVNTNKEGAHKHK